MAGQDRTEAPQAGQVFQQAARGYRASHHPGETAAGPEETGIGGKVGHSLRADWPQESVEAGLLSRLLVARRWPRLTPGICRERRGRSRADSPAARRQGRGAGGVRRRGAVPSPYGAGSAGFGPIADPGCGPCRPWVRWHRLRSRRGRGSRGWRADRRQRHWHGGGHRRAWWGRRGRRTGTWDNHKVVLVAAEGDVCRHRRAAAFARLSSGRLGSPGVLSDEPGVSDGRIGR